MAGAPSTGAVPVRDAATVMLVRDAAGGDGIEVFMLRRNLESVFVAGAYLFPGGAVDDHDRHEDLEGVAGGRSDADASALLGLAGGGLAFWVAAIRESFEESGFLLARTAEGALVDFADPAVDARFRAHRDAVDRGERRLVDVCRAEGLTLAVDALYYFAHWITPEGRPRRYDTRFFVAAAPTGQVPLHDDREAIAHLWVRPAEAVARHRDGTYEMRPPTFQTLRALERFSSAAELLAAAATAETFGSELPPVVEHRQGRRILLPGDPGYDQAIAAAPSAPTPTTTLSTSEAIGAPCGAQAGGDHGA